MRILSTAVATIILAAITAAPAFAQRAINQGQALAGGITPGDGPGFPVTLSAPGHYRLTGNLLPPATCGVHGIEVTSRLVTIDLNGFAIIGPGTGCSDGIRSVASYTVVVNGTVRNFAIGLNLAAAATEWTDEVNRVERVKAYANASVGIAAGSFSIVVDCIANQNGGTGISARHGSLLLRNGAASNQKGFVVGPWSNLQQNTARGNSVVGLELAGLSVGYGQTVLLDNGSGGPEVTGGTQIAPNICGGLPCP